MLHPKSLQSSFYGSYLYDRIMLQDHLLRKINQFYNDIAAVVDSGQVVGWSSAEGYHAVDVGSYDYYDYWY